MLTTEQIAHYETFGFLVLRQLFSAEEAATIEREAEDIFDEARAANPFDGHMWEAVQPFLERRPFLSIIPDDDRIYNIGVGPVGAGLYPRRDGGQPAKGRYAMARRGT